MVESGVKIPGPDRPITIGPTAGPVVVRVDAIEVTGS